MNKKLIRKFYSIGEFLEFCLRNNLTVISDNMNGGVNGSIELSNNYWVNFDYTPYYTTDSGTGYSEEFDIYLYKKG